MTINRIQGLVLGFFLLAWSGLIVLLAVAPEVFAQALRLPAGDGTVADIVAFWSPSPPS